MARLRAWLRLLVLIPWVTTVVTLRRLAGRRAHAEWPWLEEVLVAVFRSAVRIGEQVGPVRLRGGLSEVPRAFLPFGVTNEPSSLVGLPSEITTPVGWSPESPTFLYLHGGGYVVCDPGTHREMIARVAHRTGARCVAIDYRLAPEHPFPAALDDAQRAFLALAEEVPLDRLFLAGDSAGGGLSIATLLRLRDAGDPTPAGAFVMSPWLDHTMSGATIDVNGPTDYLNRHVLEIFSTYYRGDTDPKDPLVSPLFADLAGLPPILLQAGGLEILCAEVEAFAAAAKDAGVDVTLDVEPTGFHVFQSFGFLLPESRAALKRAGAWIRERMTPAQ